MTVSKRFDIDVMHICTAGSLSWNLCRGTCYIDVLVILVYMWQYSHTQGHAEKQLVEGLRYKPEGRGFD